MKIHSISSREILDSRGNPTLSTTVELSNGVIASASVPSGASTGANEAIELRDVQSSRFLGMGVTSAVSNVNNVLGPALLGNDAADQEKIDNLLCELDGTKNKKNMGANAILSVSLAVARAEAISREEELYEYLSFLYWGKKKEKFIIPTPMFNILNGGKHTQNTIDIQETMIVPKGLKNFSEKLRAGSEIYHHLANILDNAGFSTGLGDEGGFAPRLAKNEDVFQYVTKAIKDSGYNPEKIRVSIDLAATEFFDKKTGIYHLKNENKNYTSQKLLEKLVSWAKKYKLFSIEDGLSETDPGWKELTKNISPTLTIGDDLFTTDAEKIELGAKEKIAHGVIIKPNQIGTLMETYAAIKKAKEGKLKIIVSHRSGETEDSFIADLAVAVEADLIKAGAPARSERLAKYNRLCKIEDEINKNYYEGR